MKLLPGSQLDELWDRYWAEMSKEWFKLEVLQDYTAEDDSPSLRAWLDGDKQRSAILLQTDGDPDFTDDCRQKIAEGVKLMRIHIISEPLSAYMQWELEYYKSISIPVRGENVSIVRRRDAAGLKIPKGDLMIFDNERAILNSYDNNGRMIAADIYESSYDLYPFLELKKAIINLAKPL
jgi:hypothetical protein